MSDNASPQIVPLSEATTKSLPHGDYHHFFIRNVPVMTRVLVRPGGKTGLHLHEAEEQTYYIIKGGGILYIGGMTYNVAAQTAVLIPPGQPHAIENTGDGELEYLMQYLWPGEAAVPVYPESE